MTFRAASFFAPVVALGARLAVLVVEDNELARRVASGTLSRLGHQVDVAVNGVEALRAATARRYDVILMDVQMPEMDGLAATRALRAAGQAARIVAMTAGATEVDRLACFAAGMNAYLAKPLRVAELIAALRR